MEENCLIPLGAVQVVPRPRRTELKSIKDALRKVDRESKDCDIAQRATITHPCRYIKIFC